MKYSKFLENDSVNGKRGHYFYGRILTMGYCTYRCKFKKTPLLKLTLHGRKSTKLICTRCFAKIESLTGGRQKKKKEFPLLLMPLRRAAALRGSVYSDGWRGARRGDSFTLSDNGHLECARGHFGWGARR